MKKILLLLWVIAISIVHTYGQNDYFNVKKYGAKGDSVSLDTKAINNTIDAAAKAGGGTVYFPAGTYRCFSVHLKSNISLYIDQGATILAAEPGKEGGFDDPEPNAWGDSLHYQDFGHSHFHNSLFWGEYLENISILGPGLIYGKGLTREADPHYGDNPGKKGLGNKAIALKLCRNVIMRDFTILYGGHFAILATGVDNMTVDNVKMDTNRDGIDVDCCRNVRISNMTVNSPWDDGICLKSSFALGFARATENVTIINCEVSGFDRGTFYNGTYLFNEPHTVPDHELPTGRIKFGTESNGGFKNITISNCVFDHCRGLALETVDGGLLEDVTITNITMRDIVNSPLFLRLGGRMRGPAGTPIGKLRRIIISNLVVYNAESEYSSIISGLPNNYIEDVKLDNIRIYYKGGGTKEQAAIKPPENEKQYPEPAKMGQMPSYGFFVRHVKNIEFRNVEISYLKEDMRPAYVLNDVIGGNFVNVKSQIASGVPTMVLDKSEGITLHQCPGIADQVIEKAEMKKL